MKKIVFCIILVLAVNEHACLGAIGDSSAVDYACTTNTIYLNDGVTPLSFGTNLTDYADGFSGLVQLIYAGVDGVADFADNIGDGAMDDDVVVAYTWTGFGVTLANRQLGRFNAPNTLTLTTSATPPSYANGDMFFIRVWEDPASSVGTGFAPTTLGSFYGDSQMFTLSNMSQPIPGIDNFYMTSDLTLSLQSVPEPSTMALMALGMASVGLYRRRKKSL